MQCSLLLFVLVVLQLLLVAADSETLPTDRGASKSSSESSDERLRVAVDSETLPTDRGASESFSESSGERLRQLIVEQRRTAATDRVAAETDESPRELSAVMAATLGRIEEFDGDHEEWSQYQERLGHFFQANGVVEETKKRSVFLTLIGTNTYKLLRNLIAPEKPDTKSYTELVQILANHYSPTPAESVQRFKFHSRVRRPEESVAKFVAELRSLAEFCNFGAALEDMLRDCLVCGINDTGIQRRLLAEPKLSFKKALELAQGMESATQNVKQLQTAGTRREVPGVTRTNLMQGVHKVSHPD